MRLKGLRLALLDERDGYGRRLSRRYVNNLINQIRSFFKWGVGEELVPPSVHQGLLAVEGLRPGRTDAPDPAPIGPVSDAAMQATLPHLPPRVADMVRIQRLTGMRPGELCAMTTGELELGDEVWVYRPRKHKTAHHGKGRAVVIGPRAMDILRQYLKTDLAAPLFSPMASEKHRKSLAREALRAFPPICRVGARRYCALLPEMLTRPWSVVVMGGAGIVRPRHDAAGYWIPTQQGLEVVLEGGRSEFARRPSQSGALNGLPAPGSYLLQSTRECLAIDVARTLKSDKALERIAWLSGRSTRCRSGGSRSGCRGGRR